MRDALQTSLILLAIAATAVQAQDEDVRFYEQGGVTYRETTTRMRQPTREIEYKDQEQTVYREKYDTRVQTYRQYRYAPTTQYYWEPRVHNTWNIFASPHMAYHLQPRTNWQLQTRAAQVPITERRLEPETRMVKVAVPKLSMQERDVVSRTAVGPAAANRQLASSSQPTQPALAWNIAPQATYTPTYAWARPAQVYVPAYPQLAYGYAAPTYGGYGAYGGVAQLNSDPPRYGNYYAPNAGAWQARRDATQTR